MNPIPDISLSDISDGEEEEENEEENGDDLKMELNDDDLDGHDHDEIDGVVAEVDVGNEDVVDGGCSNVNDDDDVVDDVIVEDVVGDESDSDDSSDGGIDENLFKKGEDRRVEIRFSHIPEGAKNPTLKKELEKSLDAKIKIRSGK